MEETTFIYYRTEDFDGGFEGKISVSKYLVTSEFESEKEELLEIVGKDLWEKYGNEANLIALESNINTSIFSDENHENLIVSGCVWFNFFTNFCAIEDEKE